MILTPSSLRAVVLDCLRRPRQSKSTDPPYQVSILWEEVAKVAQTRRLMYTETLPAARVNSNGRAELHPNLKQPVWDVVWDLIIEGVLRPGERTRDPYYELPYIHVTDYGLSALNDVVTPYDPDGYLKRLTERIPTVDPIIIKYIAESAEALRRNCLLSSTITLGCASEKAFLLLLEAYRDALNTADQARFDAAISKVRGIKQKHQEFMKDFEKLLKPRLKASVNDSDWMTSLENALANVFSYFRDMRNDAGHPTGVTFNRDLALSHLVVFPYYLRTFYDGIEWLDANKPL